MAERISQLKAMLQAEPTDTFCLYGLAMEHARLGLHAEAVEWFDRALAVDPNYCYAYFHKAKSLEQAGNDSAATATLREGLARARSSGDTKAASEIAAYLDELS